MVGINEAKIAENIAAEVLYNNWTYMQLRGKVLNKMYSPKYCAASYVMSKDGAKPQIIWEFTFELRRGETVTRI